MDPRVRMARRLAIAVLLATEHAPRMTIMDYVRNRLADWLFYAALALFAVLVMYSQLSDAQTQQCVCTAGCDIASDPYPPATATVGQPTTCTVYKAGVQIGTGAVVPSTSIPTSNAASCLPSSATYNPGPAGSVACKVTIPAQPVGNVTLTMRASNAAGSSPDSAAWTFANVAFLPVTPAAPTGLRLTP